MPLAAPRSITTAAKTNTHKKYYYLGTETVFRALRLRIFCFPFTSYPELSSGNRRALGIVRAMASLISSTQLLHDGSKAIVNAHTLTRPSIDGLLQNSAAGKARGPSARAPRGRGVWTGGAAVSRPGPPARAPAAPGPTDSLRRAPQPPRSCAPKGSRVRRAERGSPGEPSTPLPGEKRRSGATHLRGGRPHSFRAAAARRRPGRAARRLGSAEPRGSRGRRLPGHTRWKPRRERSSAERVWLDAGFERRLGRGSRGLAKSPQPLCSSDVNQGAKPGPLLTHARPRRQPRPPRQPPPPPPPPRAPSSRS